MDRGSLSGDDGPTHHGLFDISYLRGIPNIVHMVPKDEDELADMLYTATLHKGPIAIRYPRGAGMGVEMKPFPKVIPIGKAEILRHSENDRVAIFALGAMVPLAEEIAAQLEKQDVSAAVINARFSKPLDSQTVEFFARSVDVILTLEDHVLMGGFGSAVLEELSNLGIQKPVERIGWPDQFIEHGKPEQLRAKYGLTAAAALQKLLPHLQLREPRRAPIPFRAVSR
jgi:1-deoxy-D-xylulose-5-phosphate synthase